VWVVGTSEKVIVHGVEVGIAVAVEPPGVDVAGTEVAVDVATTVKEAVGGTMLVDVGTTAVEVLPGVGVPPVAHWSEVMLSE
jgi:hypothetical protein